MTAVEVHALDEGRSDGPVVVLSNSLGTTLDMWEPQMAALTERFRVIRYDHRGHGGSPVPPGPYRIEDLAGDVLALLDRLRIARANVCGASMGGQVAMWIAAHAPERVDRLVLCCTSPVFGPPELWVDRAKTVRSDGTGAVAATVVGRWFTPDFAAANPEVVERFRDMIASTPPEGYAACCEAVGAADLRPDLGAIRARTLVIAGAEDPAVPRERTQELGSDIADARVEIVDPGAHLSSVERSDRVTELIVEHFRSEPA
jgi:3-oxoadipate enol-lactonase